MFQSFNPKYIVNTPFLFFTGKGGVGKTSTACATAIHLADAGKKVLLVSTDPASNLQDVLEVDLTNTPRSVPTVDNLLASNIDPEEAASEYREKAIGPYRNKLPQSVIATMEEQLSGACTVEMAAFDEFATIISNPSVNQYDHVIFDTAPTGHTLRLLQLPTAWNGFLEDSTHGASCLGPLSGLQEKKELYKKTVDALSDGNQTTLILVTRPETVSLYETNRSAIELKEIGIRNQALIVNGLMQKHISNDEVSTAFFERQQNALKKIPDGLKQLAIYSLPFVSYALTGIGNLRYLFKQYVLPAKEEQSTGDEQITLPNVTCLIDSLSEKGTKVIFTMGKGGVGKTTVASTIAVGLAEKGHKVHLTTTDPAAHLDYLFSSGIENNLLSISSIDPKKEVEVYKKDVITKASKNLDADGIAYLQEDLDSPCTEEIAVFQAFAEKVAQANDEIVVIDTAPTGHTLLLLDATEEYHKELTRSTGEVSDSVRELLPRLRNSKETSVVIVTLAETTPVLESKRLQEDLIRANIKPDWWVINQSFQATGTKDPILAGRAKMERKWIKEVTYNLAKNAVVIPWIGEEKIGYSKLKDYITN